MIAVLLLEHAVAYCVAVSSLNVLVDGSSFIVVVIVVAARLLVSIVVGAVLTTDIASSRSLVSFENRGVGADQKGCRKQQFPMFVNHQQKKH